MNPPASPRGPKSGRGQPYSKTFGDSRRSGWRASVLECGSPLPLWLLLLALPLALVHPTPAASPPLSITVNESRGELEVRFKDRKLLVYAFATNQFKPYVRELYTLHGENVLRDAPPDHLHHHGLMYAVCVNGVNFWEEKAGAGLQRLLDPPLGAATMDAQGMPVAYFTQLIRWVAPTNPTPLLHEKRTITVTINATNDELALRWEAEFKVGAQAGTVSIHGPNYDGLGLRLPESFNHVATFHNSAGLPYPGKNTQNVNRAAWTSVSGVMDGRDLMLAMFGRKENAGGDAAFFTMLDPFAYLSATQGLDKKPLEYAAGEHFSLSYLLTVYSENKSPEFIQRRCQLWEKERR
jgi:hypothetical protein